MWESSEMDSGQMGFQGETMRLSEEQRSAYWRDGYVVVDDVFSSEEIEILRRESEIILAEDRTEILKEDDSDAPRQALGCHTYNDVFLALGHERRLVEPAMQLLEESVYIHQFKVNPKTAFSGGAFLWHQDFPVWERDDGMLEPRAVNIALFMDDISSINGALLVVPGSHLAEPPKASPKKDDYIIANDIVEEMVQGRGIVSADGRKGSVLFFHGNTLHASSGNITPFPRRIVYVTYCAVSNYIRTPSRPEWVAHRDFSAIVPTSGLIGART
jgi:ectoine hydroxylase